ncbi:hypothetical protein BD414DRAFT_280299 [Trametes punicea]|nr:hypothetical protein BD414DRAFT_280299 [Trametes punicea]
MRVGRIALSPDNRYCQRYHRSITEALFNAECTKVVKRSRLHQSYSAMNTSASNTEQLEYPLPSRKASGPFDRDDADLIMRSSDRVDFYVHRIILSLASPIFAGMFTLPQPCNTTPNLALVDVVEDSEVIDVFLRICYPIPDPDVFSLDLIREVMAAAIKYEATAAVAAMKRALSHPRLLEDDPLRVFAIACYFGLEEEAKAAAEKAVIKEVVMGKTCLELDQIPAAAYYRLLQLVRTRKTVKSKAPVLERIAVDFTGIRPFCDPPRLPKVPTRKPVGSPTAPFDVPADLILRSGDSVDFHISRHIITLASPEFLERLLLLGTMQSSDDQEGEQQRPIYGMTEDSTVVDTLLRMCYPVEHPHLVDDLDLLLDVLSAGRKYGVKKVETIISGLWPAIVEKDPFRLYFTAVQYGWPAEAGSCASALLRLYDVPTIYSLYTETMETMDNGPYRHLLFYIEECSKAAATDHTIATGLVPKYCTTATACAERYPSTFFTSTPPAWLSHQLTAIKSALKDKPHGSTLTVHGELATSFITAVVVDTPPCMKNPSTFYKPCSAADNASWACAILGGYAKEVDAAVNKVKFEPLAKA